MLETRPLTNELTNEYCLVRFNDWYENGFSHSAMPSSGVLVKIGEGFKKEIAKKPIKINYEYNNNITIKYTCRVCDYILPNEIVEILVKRDGHDLTFCPHCGHAIDWSK